MTMSTFDLPQCGVKRNLMPMSVYWRVRDQMNVKMTVISRRGTNTMLTFSIVFTPRVTLSADRNIARKCVSSGQYVSCR